MTNRICHRNRYYYLAAYTVHTIFIMQALEPPPQLDDLLYWMLQSGDYTLPGTWAFTHGTTGTMNREIARALMRIILDPRAVTRQDISLVFFADTSDRRQHIVGGRRAFDDQDEWVPFHDQPANPWADMTLEEATIEANRLAAQALQESDSDNERPPPVPQPAQPAALRVAGPVPPEPQDGVGFFMAPGPTVDLMED